MIFSLQRRFFVLLLIPVTLVLTIVGLASYLYARSFLLDQWNLTTRLSLARTAHEIRMKLDEKREMMKLIVLAEQNGDPAQPFLIEQLRRRQGVTAVTFDTAPVDGAAAAQENTVSNANSGNPPELSVAQGLGEFHSAHGVESSDGRPVQMNVNAEKGYLTLVTEFPSENGTELRRLSVTVRLDYLVQGLLHASLWQGGFACLVAADGEYLAHTDHTRNWPEKLGQTGRSLEEEVLKEMKNRESGAVFGQGAQADMVMGYYRLPTTPWYLILTAPKNEILSPVLRFRYGYLSAVLAAVLLIGLLIRVNTKPVADSIAEIAEAAEKVEQGDYSVKLSERRADEIGRLGRRFNRMVEGLHQKRIIERTFGRYVDKSIAQELLSKPEALHMGGEEHVVTILMADLRGFTPMAKKLRPDQVIQLLNGFFSRMIPIIEKHKGIIVDFLGDSILVFFNGLEPDVRVGAANAVTCATEMQRELTVVSQDRLPAGLPALSMGIGVHTGEVIVGNIGCETRAKYGIVGSAVNETQRIQAFAQGGQIMITGRTYALLADRLDVGPKCEACLKGIEGTLDLYEVRKLRSAV